MEQTMNKAVLVGGTFDDGAGEKSGFAHKLRDALITTGLTDLASDFVTLNGGNFSALNAYLETYVPQAKYIFWFPNVSNKYPKLVTRIKATNRKCILVTSKRNHDASYSFPDLVQHALKNKSNLLVEFQKRKEDGKVFSRIIDPLGNVIVSWTDDVVELAKGMAKRVKYLQSITRVGSIRVGDSLEVPDEPKFFEFVRASAECFAELLPTPTENHRFLGNASFRCRHGFPSFKKDGLIYVSKRNIDKAVIGPEGFVAVNADKLPVEYYGNHKPSVDAPIHVRLYEIFPNINYMLHGHVYIKGVKKTKVNIPCGGLEEAEEIVNAVNHYSGMRYTDGEFFATNLKGHGFIAGFSDVRYFDEILPRIEYEYESRPFPEEI